VRDSSPVILARHLSHRFGSSEVLHDISFDVGRAEIFGFIGPNGAGKTTTIRAMATLLEPSSGHIEIAGIDVGLEPERVRPMIGYMADQAGVYPKLTVEEYLAFFAAMYRLDPGQAVDRALDLTSLGPARGELSGTLSKGMRQRLQLTKTLLHDPEVLILDEPASDLDPRARIEMRDLFLRLRDAKKTIFLSSHILTELSDVCTSVGVIEKGRLVAHGPIAQITQELQRGPATGAVSPTDAAARAKRLKIRTLGTADGARLALEGFPSVTTLRASGDLVVVGVQGGDDLVAALVKRLVEAGIGVIGVEPERDELETAFLELTNKEKT
jgi:ABC-2 type transport system ATP-binding protein